MIGWRTFIGLCAAVVGCAYCLTCPDTWESPEGTDNCYKLFNDEKVWDDANSHCTSLGGHLLTLETAEEASALADYVADMGEPLEGKRRAWFHIGIRRVESHRHNVPTRGMEGFTWVDGTPLSVEHTNYLNWNLSTSDNIHHAWPGPSALQTHLYESSWYVEFSARPEWSLDIPERYICKMSKNLLCTHSKANTTLMLKDSRMTPLLCVTMCLAGGYRGYASVNKEKCSCSNSYLSVDEQRIACDTYCKVETWLSCGGSNGSSLHRALTFYGRNVIESMLLLECSNLYSNGVVKGAKVNGEYCSVPADAESEASKELYCNRPELFPLRSVCIYISKEFDVDNYHSAQFDVCGQRAHSDLIVLNSPLRRGAATSLSKSTAKPYGESEEINIILKTFFKMVAPHIPYLRGSGLNYVLIGAITHKMSNHPRTTHGSLATHWPDMMESVKVQPPHTLVLNLSGNDNMASSVSLSEEMFQHQPLPDDVVVVCSDIPGDLGCRNMTLVETEMTEEGKEFILVFEDRRLLNLYGCIEICRGTTPQSHYAYVTSSRCLCSDSIKGPAKLENLSQCFSPCADPSSIQQCPSTNDLARIFSLDAFPRMANSCEQLWQNGAYYYGLYRVRSPANSSDSLLVLCNNVPQYSGEYEVISTWSVEGTGSAPPSWTTQLRSHLFSSNPLQFDGTGYFLSANDPELTISFPHFHLVRGLKVLGRGDYDIGVQRLARPRGYVTKLTTSYYGLSEEQLFLNKDEEANLKHEEDLAVVSFNRAVITKKLRIEVKEFKDAPALRVEIVGVSLKTLLQIQQLEILQNARNFSLGCYKRDSNAGVEYVTAVNQESAIKVCADKNSPYMVVESTNPDAANGSSTQFACHSGGRMQVEKVKETYCHSSKTPGSPFYKYFDTFNISMWRCPYPPDAPQGYRWNGINLINQHIQLECEEPTNSVLDLPYTQYRCLSTLEWDKEISYVDLPQCALLPCVEKTPNHIHASVVEVDKALFPGDRVEYICNEEMYWVENVSQKAMCSGRRQWELILPLRECVYRQCPAYVPGFMNTSDNLPPSHESVNPELYALFKQRLWRSGTTKELRCPPESSFSNARRVAEALCSSENYEWALPFGNCIEAETPNSLALEKSDSESSRGSLNKYIPIIVILSVLMVGTIFAYVAVMMYNARRGLEFKETSQADVRFRPPLFSIGTMDQSQSQLGADSKLGTPPLKRPEMIPQSSSNLSVGSASITIPPIVVGDFDKKTHSANSLYFSTKADIRNMEDYPAGKHRYLLPHSASGSLQDSESINGTSFIEQDVMNLPDNSLAGSILVSEQTSIEPSPLDVSKD